MTKDEVLAEFRDSQALLEGHFLLTSGLHSPLYLQCARVLMEPRRAERLCRALADKVISVLGKEAIDCVVSPALGGIVVGYEVARQLSLPAMFVERSNGSFALRRGFEIVPGARVLVAEDVVTTGLSSRECIACIQEHGGKVVAACCLADRSNGTAEIGVPLISLLAMKVPSYPADQLPPELARLPAIKPGSRTQI